MKFCVVSAHNEDTDGYHLYVANLPGELTPRQVGALYGLWWEVELTFRELRSLYGLEKFQTSNPAIVEPLVVAVLLTPTVSRALLGVFQELSPETVLPRKCWAKTLRSLARFMFEDLAQSFGRLPPNLSELLFHGAHQPREPRFLLNEQIAEAFRRRSSI